MRYVRLSLCLFSLARRSLATLEGRGVMICVDEIEEGNKQAREGGEGCGDWAWCTHPCTYVVCILRTLLIRAKVLYI